MIKVLDGVLYGFGGALGAMVAVQFAKEISPWLIKTFYFLA